MERIDIQTPNIAKENAERLLELFPQVATEIENEDGEIERAVDYDALRELLGDVAEGARERYQFTWPGKREAKAEARRPIDKTMRPCPEESVNWDTTQNLYIEGDNLDALKILRETYAGKVKLIYIDPPYNTGHDFVYDDDFSKTHAEYDAESGEYDEGGGRLVANPESNGRFHSDWCSMMYPRLMLARDLLSADGAIFISIDDNEEKNLRAICDEVFGVQGFIACIPRQSRASVQNDTDISSSHEYVLAYAKNRRMENRRLKESNAAEWHSTQSFACYPKPLDRDRYENPDNDPRGPWKADPMDAPNVRPNLTYPITNPNTGEQHLPPRGRHWRISPERFSSVYEDGRVIFGKNGLGRPQLKVFYEEKKMFGEVDNTWWDAERITTNSAATKDLMNLFDGIKVFDTPKPVDLIESIIHLSMAAGSNDVIVDFFSGSAATAEAAMRVNAADGGNRKTILVQIPDDLNESAAANAIGLSTIAEIGKERIRRAGAKIAAEIEESNRQLKLGEEPKPVPDVGFRVLKIDSSNMRDTHFNPQSTQQESLLDLIDNVKEGRAPEDLLFQVLPKFRIPYSASIEKLDVNGKLVFNVDDGLLLACFDIDVDTDTIEHIARMKPSYAVMRDLSFKDDAAEANFEEIFKTFSPDTIRRVM